MQYKMKAFEDLNYMLPSKSIDIVSYTLKGYLFGDNNISLIWRVKKVGK